MLTRRWITVKEASEYLSLHVQSIYRLTYQNRIPFYKKPGFGIRIDKPALDKLLENGEQLPSDWKELKP